MKKGGIITTLFSLLLLLYGAVLIADSYVTLPGALLPVITFTEENIALSWGEHSLLVPALFSIFESLMIAICRKKRSGYIVFSFYMFIMYFTLIVFTHLRRGMATPAFIMSRVDSSRLSLIGLLIVLEALLAFIILYVTARIKRKGDDDGAINRDYDLDEPLFREKGPKVSRKKIKRQQAREKKREEKRLEKERSAEEKRQKKLEMEAEAEAERAEKEVERERVKEEKRLEKAEAKQKRKEEKREERKAKRKAEDDDVAEAFSTEDLNVEMKIPPRAMSMDQPLSFPDFASIPRLNTIEEHSEDLDMVSPDPQQKFRDALGLGRRGEESSFSIMHETEDHDLRERPKTNHFKKGGIIEAALESMNSFNSGSAAPSAPLFSDESKKKAGEGSIAPSGLSKDHPRYKLFESLKNTPSQSLNVSHVPSMPFESTDEREAIVDSYGSTYKKSAEKKSLSERLDDIKRESISASGAYSSLAQPSCKDEIEEDEESIISLPSERKAVAENVFENEDKVISRRKASLDAEDEALRAEDIESLDQKHKGKYDDGSAEVRQENEIYYSVGIAGLASNDAGMSGIRQRARMKYTAPSADILLEYPAADREIDALTVQRGQQILNTLHEFKVDVSLDNIVKGPTVTMYELKLADGVPVSKVKARYDDLQYALGVRSIRILAPVPGKTAVGVEVPNMKRATIGFKDMLEQFYRNKENQKMAVPMILGRTITGEPISINVAKAPHLLIAGSTGSGKSVGINSLIATILYTRSPRDVRLMMVDPKVVELKIYNGIPHLLTPVITDAKKVKKALAWLTEEMDRRYEMISRYNVRNIEAFNEKLKKDRLAAEKLPYIVLIMDEYADLMSTIGKDIEYYVGRLTAMARAVGIHLVLATQRPSAEVVTGTIKNNIPSRIAFAVASGVNSKIILDEMGAEALLGKGDMLYKTPSSIETLRIQGAFLSDGEVEEIVEQVKMNGEPEYLDDSIFEEHEEESEMSDSAFLGIDSEEEEYERAKQIVYEKKSASASYLQRRMKIGYNKAARYVERMEEDGIVGPPNGSKPRELIKMA